MGIGCSVWQQHNPTLLASFCINHIEEEHAHAVTLTTPTTTTTPPRSLFSLSRSFTIINNNGRITRMRSPFCIPQSQKTQDDYDNDNDNDSDSDSDNEVIEWKQNIRNSGIISSCLVGLLTGVAVVLFNSIVHEIRDFVWDGIPSRGASWLREAPIQETWTRVILVPTFGGVIVSLLNSITQRLHHSAASRPFFKAFAASITLGTGNSLGPEGPSVDIGTSIAKAVGSFFQNNNNKRMLSLRAAGSAAGLSSGFNAAVAGCFFAVESVLWPSPAASDDDDDDAPSLPLTNTTSMVILSAVIASVVSEIGLGSQPAFRVPEYDFRSPGELPLYLLLGILCGLVSLALSRCTSYMLTIVDNLPKTTGIPRASFPVLGGLSVGIIALLYPEILYWGFENVDILLESRPFFKGLSTDLLLQLIAVKIVATSLCRASGLVGGYYAPSLFIGAATGMAYGKLIGLAVAEFNPMINLSGLEVASPQAYGLVGMAATLAGVCQVPLTAVLLLFELTQDYRIVLPLLGAVGLSTWISSVQTKRGDARRTKKLQLENSNSAILPETSSCCSIESSPGNSIDEGVPYLSSLYEVDSSLRVEDDNAETAYPVRRTFVSEAMKTRYVTVSMCTLLIEVIDLMLSEKESCAVIVDTDGSLISLLTLRDIQEYGKIAKARSKKPKKLLVSELCLLNGGICSIPWTATADMELGYAQKNMKKHGMDHVPVVRNINERSYPVGILDRDSISITCSALNTRQSLKS
ncbi:PREDICTED: chloride channel protein CLC-e isoform X2 [Lupinus angustifolius]|uniref:chloride channel protein CLC-e isoform X2 n=1 Tax=Lupinus angustifolius TaxID=3871 RepID=UPI00092EDADB|nr:PREDICTED: chloride channel protein CLC-e isoform X2 [Lupinus angustifolius]